MRFHRGTAACAVALVMVSGLAACGDEEPTEPFETKEPTSQSSSSRASGSSSSGSGSSSSGSSSSGGTSSDDLPADLPEAAREETKEGAAAFGEYYYKALGDAGHTGDPATLELMDASECLVCSDVVAGIKEDEGKGWRRSINPYSMSNVEAKKRPDEGYKVSMAVKVKAHERLDSNGQANATVDATEYTLTEHVVWRDGRWQMLDWVVT
ncbi:DUF6318 family protein [Janibacter sp. RAF52]|uniref:DUF6318 family protein n=1 Tax=unclassified Janibacter TaxID=2649294 RepID=UPI003F939DB7